MRRPASEFYYRKPVQSTSHKSLIIKCLWVLLKSATQHYTVQLLNGIGSRGLIAEWLTRTFALPGDHLTLVGFPVVRALKCRSPIVVR